MGQQLRRLNECASSLQEVSQIKEDAVEINRETILLWLNIITVFRTQGLGEFYHDLLASEPQLNHTGSMSYGSWQHVSDMYEETMRNIGDAIKRVERLVELTERHARMIDMDLIRKFVALPKLSGDVGKLPCRMLPVAPNPRFFGRKDVLREIEKRLIPAENSNGLRSLAIHGLGGIGKTQIALAFAYEQFKTFDAIFWLAAGNELALQGSFEEVAIKWLKLPDAKPGANPDNKLLVMEWLRQTCRWTLYTLQ